MMATATTTSSYGSSSVSSPNPLNPLNHPKHLNRSSHPTYHLMHHKTTTTVPTFPQSSSASSAHLPAIEPKITLPPIRPKMILPPIRPLQHPTMQPLQPDSQTMVGLTIQPPSMGIQRDVSDITFDPAIRLQQELYGPNESSEGEDDVDRANGARYFVDVRRDRDSAGGVSCLTAASCDLGANGAANAHTGTNMVANGTGATNGNGVAIRPILRNDVNVDYDDSSTVDVSVDFIKDSVYGGSVFDDLASMNDDNGSLQSNDNNRNNTISASAVSGISATRNNNNMASRIASDIDDESTIGGTSGFIKDSVYGGSVFNDLASVDDDSSQANNVSANVATNITGTNVIATTTHVATNFHSTRSGFKSSQRTKTLKNNSNSHNNHNINSSSNNNNNRKDNDDAANNQELINEIISLKMLVAELRSELQFEKSRGICQNRLNNNSGNNNNKDQKYESLLASIHEISERNTSLEEENQMLRRELECRNVQPTSSAVHASKVSTGRHRSDSYLSTATPVITNITRPATTFSNNNSSSHLLNFTNNIFHPRRRSDNWERSSGNSLNGIANGMNGNHPSNGRSAQRSNSDGSIDTYIPFGNQQVQGLGQPQDFQGTVIANKSNHASDIHNANHADHSNSLDTSNRSTGNRPVGVVHRIYGFFSPAVSTAGTADSPSVTSLKMELDTIEVPTKGS